MNALQYAIIDFNRERIMFTGVQETLNQVPQFEVLVYTNKISKSNLKLRTGTIVDQNSTCATTSSPIMETSLGV